MQIINNISNIKKKVLLIRRIKDLNIFYLILLLIRLIIVYSFIKNKRKLNKNSIKKFRFLKFIYQFW